MIDLRPRPRINQSLGKRELFFCEIRISSDSIVTSIRINILTFPLSSNKKENGESGSKDTEQGVVDNLVDTNLIQLDT